MIDAEWRARPSLGPWCVLAIGLAAAVLARSVALGADALWLVALGDRIAADKRIPDGVPFATADTSGWHNVPVIGELVFSGAHRVGPMGLPILQILLVTAALTLLGWAARRSGASSPSTALVLVLVTLGALPAFGVIRAQVLSFVGFAAVTALLRAEHSRPTRGVWWLVPLVALWGNLHGAVLVGVAVAGCYLLLSRCRVQPLTAIPVGVAAVLALLVNPAGLGTVPYYLGALGNEAARRGTQMWSRPTLTQPFDILLIAAAVILVALAVRGRLPVWEYVALAGLTVAMLTASRHGVWLLLFAAPRAAIHLTRGIAAGGAARTRRTAAVASVLIATLATALSLWWLAPRADTLEPDAVLVSTIGDMAGSGAVLAPEPLVEALAVHGQTVWVGNPIDAFSRADQAAYLDAYSGGLTAQRAVDGARVAVTQVGSPLAELLTAARGFTYVGELSGVRFWKRTE